jgi:uncharacterized Zn finger protein
MTTCFCGASASSLLREEIRGGKKRDIVRCDRCGAVRKDQIDT